MRRLLLHLIAALLTFSVGYSLAWVTEVYNLKTEIREYERRAEADKRDEKLLDLIRSNQYMAQRVNWCIKILREDKKKAEASNIARCLKEREDVPLE
jgi:hypothetical protein